MKRLEAFRENIKNISREEWLKMRLNGIGGSDAGIVMGLSKWRTPFSLWLEKTGREPSPDLSSNEKVYFGTQLENFVAKEFEKRSNIKIKRSSAMFRSANNPFMIANIDRVVVGQKKGLECKTTSALNAAEWDGDLVPDLYYAQCQHYISVMNWDSCFIACLIGGQRFEWKEIPRNDAFIEEMVDAERHFWSCVKNDDPPEITGRDDVSGLFPEQKNSDFLPATAELTERVKSLTKIDQIIKRNEEERAKIVNDLKMIIGDSAGITGLCSWKQNKDSVKIDWKALAVNEFSPNEEIIAKYTTAKAGARPFKIMLKEDE